jgi:hypothetical protein
MDYLYFLYAHKNTMADGVAMSHSFFYLNTICLDDFEINIIKSSKSFCGPYIGATKMIYNSKSPN